MLLCCDQLCLALCPHRLHPPWDFPGKSTGVSCHFLFQGDLTDPGIEPTSPALEGGFFTTEPSLVYVYIYIHPLGSVSKESPNTELLAKSLISFVLWFSHLWDEKPNICLLCLVRTWLCVWWNEQIAQIHDTLERIMKSLRAGLCLTSLSLRKIHWTPTRHQHYHQILIQRSHWIIIHWLVLVKSCI